MNNTSNTLHYTFLGLAAVELLAEATGHHSVIYITKPLLMPVLGLWLFFSTARHAPGFLRRTMLAGLAFSTIGDTLLLFAGGPSGALFFLLGLGAFLFAHLCYIGGYHSIASYKHGYVRLKPVIIVPFALFLCGFLWYLAPGMPHGMGGPVNAYALVISVMALSACNTRNKVNDRIFVSLVAGALLFMLSDSLIAVNKFKTAIPGASLWIMSTYLAGQYLIIRGVSLFLSPKHHITQQS